MHPQRETQNNETARALHGLRLKPLSAVVLSALGMLPAVSSAAPEPAPEPSPEPTSAQFDPAFLGAAPNDLSRFERGNPVAPGDYRVDVYINQAWLGREGLSFRAIPDSDIARPCLSRELLERAGVDTLKLETTAGQYLNQQCVDLVAAIPESRVAYDSGELRLDISIPQALMTRHARGYVSPGNWEEGVTAATLNYNLNAYASQARDEETQVQASLGLNAGLNVGGWRLRQQSLLSWRKGDHGAADTHDWQNIATYAQHDITPWRAQLTLGDAYTTGEIFGSFGFRGARVASDDRMLPDSMVGYAPTVRGIAQTNARVEVRQKGYVIYDTTVTPGPFEINDIYASGYGGDLDVTVTEADGRKTTFVVPYANVPQLLRPGATRFSATAGEYRTRGHLRDSDPLVAEGTYQRGINNILTLYGGVQAAEKSIYSAAALGAAFNTPIGAVSGDITFARTKVADGWTGDDKKLNGHSARVNYSKTIPQTRTDFALAAYRYSSEGFRDLDDAITLQDRKYGFEPGQAFYTGRHQRSRFQLSLNQRLGARAGSLYASGTRADYWDDREIDTNYLLGYTNRFRNLSYNVTASRTRDLGGRYDNQYYASLTVPLGVSSGLRATPAPMLSIGATHDSHGNDTRATVSGGGGKEQQFSYSVDAIAGNRDGGGRGSVGTNVQYRAPYADLGASYTYSRGYQQASLGVTGGIVAHPGGITLSRPLGDTIAIVHANDAAGARVSSSNNVRLDRRGYAVVNYATPYRMNTIDLDPKGLSADVELDTTSQRFAPRAGSVTMLNYESTVGQPFFVKGVMADGNLLPFGAQVLDEHGIEIGLVGQNGIAFVRSPDMAGALTVKWGGDASQQCRMQYQLPKIGGGGRYQQVEASCVYQGGHQ